MSSEESDCDIDCTPPYLKAEAELAKNDLLPPKSKERYLNNYEKFMKWKAEQQTTSWSENVFLAYFINIRQTMKPSTLWAVYYMLRSVVLNKHDVNIKNYLNLTAWLKRQSDGYKSKKSKIFNFSQNIQQFLNDAPDDKYLAMKVALIMGVNGACRSMELTNLTTRDVEYHETILLVNLRDTKTKIDRSFVIREEFAKFVKKYQDLRPADMKSDNFFINYRNEKCIKQNIGRHKIAAIPKEIATYLNLPNPEAYTGHCFRRSSATLLADSGANLTTIKRHGGWKSDRVAEGYIEESIGNKTEITGKINTNIKLRQPLQEPPIIENQPSPSQQEPPAATENQPSTSSYKRPLSPVIDHPTKISTSQADHTNISQTNINVPGKSIKISISNCPNMTNVTFNIS